jgi:hypothetical protein
MVTGSDDLPARLGQTYNEVKMAGHYPWALLLLEARGEILEARAEIVRLRAALGPREVPP